MPSRMDKYYKSNIKKRTDRNKELYKTMYEDTEYTNVEGISVIEKNEKIDIDKIRELINGTNNINKPKIEKPVEPKPLVEEIEEQKNYDIRDVLNKAKTERTNKDSMFSNIKYNALINEELAKEVKEESEIESISMENEDALDLLDDLKSICDPELKKEINKKEPEIIKENSDDEIDKSFYTSSLKFKDTDFGDDTVNKKNNKLLPKLLLFILLILMVSGILFLIYHI